MLVPSAFEKGLLKGDHRPVHLHWHRGRLQQLHRCTLLKRRRRGGEGNGDGRSAPQSIGAFPAAVSALVM